MQLAEPYISLVVTARNDDHGGNLLTRMQAFADGWIEQCTRFELNSELIIVEWNPVEDRPSLADAIVWPADNRHCQVRVITVPASVHRRYRHADALGLYQMIAKNVGIRRARGQFVLATNIDILFSDELMRSLARRDLSPSRMYRIDRHDAMSEIPSGVGIQQRLEWCAAHLLRLNAREGTFAFTVDEPRAAVAGDIVAPESGIELGKGWSSPERDGRLSLRWIDSGARVRFRVPEGRADVRLAMFLEPGAGVGFGPFLLQAADQHGNKLAEVRVLGREVVELPIGARPGTLQEITLHVVGGGDQLITDPRVLNARVLALGWEPGSDLNGRTRVARWKWPLWIAMRRLKGEVVAPPPPQLSAGLSFGPGWGPWERLGSGYARWIDAEGELALTGGGGGGELEIDAGLGPDAMGGPVRVTINDSEGNELCAVMLDGRRQFTWSASEGEKPVRVVRVRCERPCKHTGTGGGRLLLVHHISWKPTSAHSSGQSRSRPARPPTSAVYLHTNGCGDFTLLSRAAWFELRGYPEFDAFSMNIDSILCWAAHHAGYREEVFEEPMRIYHIEHGSGSGWTPEGQAKLYERISREGIPWIEYPDVIGWARDMNRLDAPFIFNLGNWGLAADEFEERVIP